MATKKLTADLLAGISQTEDMTVDVGGNSFEISIRPLTVAERGRVTAMAQKGMKLRGNANGPTAELEEVMLAQHESNVMTVALGMIEPQLSKTQLEKSVFPIDDVAKAIKKLSGMKVEDDEQPEKTHAEGAEFPEDEV